MQSIFKFVRLNAKGNILQDAINGNHKRLIISMCANPFIYSICPSSIDVVNFLYITPSLGLSRLQFRWNADFWILLDSILLILYLYLAWSWRYHPFSISSSIYLSQISCNTSHALSKSPLINNFSALYSSEIRS